MKNKFIILSILLLNFISLSFAESLKVNDKIPNIIGKTIDGKNFTVADYGGKYILIDIGSTMCLPCQETLKQFQQLKNKYPELVVISINIDGDLFQQNVKDFLKQNNIKFPIILDDDKKLYNSFKSEIIPYVIFADKTGKVLNVVAGEEIDIEKEFNLKKYFTAENETVLKTPVNDYTNNPNVLAVVNNETITIDEFQEIFNSLGAQHKLFFQNAPDKLLDELINQKILYNEALRAGIDKRKDVRDSIDKTVRNILVQVLVEEKMKNIDREQFQDKFVEYISSIKKNDTVKIFNDRLSKFEPKIDRMKLPDFIKTNKPVMAALGAGSCMPCRMMQPALKELTEEYKEKIDIVFIDVNEERDKAMNFPIQVIPSQFFFDKNGNETFRHEGYFSKEEIVEQLKKIDK